MEMLADGRGVRVVNEPQIGVHLVPREMPNEEGEYFEHGPRADDPSYLFARRNLDAIRPHLREAIAAGIAVQAGADDRRAPRRIVLKEPNGSHAADSIISLFPRSRLIFLIRDGRDVVDSMADAMLRAGSWWLRYHDDDPGTARRDRQDFLRRAAELWVGRTTATQRAYEMLPERRRLEVRYERLRRRTTPELERVFDWLGTSGRDPARTIARRHSFARIPADRRGPGLPQRAAEPGLWSRNFTKREQRLLNRIMGPKLEELGYKL